jgi:putative ABC transport system ATP-binding protein
MIYFQNVSKTYCAGSGISVAAVRDVSLEIDKGEYVGIVGPSGSGKSTMLYLAGLLDRPTTGRIVFEGKDTSIMGDPELSHLRGRAIGFVFQSFHLVPHLTVLENVALPLFYQGVEAGERRRRAMERIESVNLDPRSHHLPGELSGGERQRAAIARALIAEPDVILADEPTGNLDSKNGLEILAMFDSLHKQGKTLVVITHDRGIAERIPRTVRIADGAIEEDTKR